MLTFAYLLSKSRVTHIFNGKYKTCKCNDTNDNETLPACEKFKLALEKMMYMLRKVESRSHGEI